MIRERYFLRLTLLMILASSSLTGLSSIANASPCDDGAACNESGCYEPSDGCDYSDTSQIDSDTWEVWISGTDIYKSGANGEFPTDGDGTQSLSLPAGEYVITPVAPPGGRFNDGAKAWTRFPHLPSVNWHWTITVRDSAGDLLFSQLGCVDESSANDAFDCAEAINQTFTLTESDTVYFRIGNTDDCPCNNSGGIDFELDIGTCNDSDTLTLEDHEEDGTVSFTRAGDILAHNGYVVKSTADVELISDTKVTLDDGFSVESGALFKAEADSNSCT